MTKLQSRRRTRPQRSENIVGTLGYMVRHKEFSKWALDALIRLSSPEFAGVRSLNMSMLSPESSFQEAAHLMHNITDVEMNSVPRIGKTIMHELRMIFCRNADELAKKEKEWRLAVENCDTLLSFLQWHKAYGRDRLLSESRKQWSRAVVNHETLLGFDEWLKAQEVENAVQS